MMAAPGTFTSGQVLTAAEMNALPAGLVASDSSNSIFSTSATHTNAQDTGIQVTFDEISGRVYRHQAQFNPYPNGGLQDIILDLLRDGTLMRRFIIPSAALAIGTSFPFLGMFVYTSSASGSVTWKWQMAARTLNTQVRDFGDANTPRQYIVEDIQQ